MFDKTLFGELEQRGSRDDDKKIISKIAMPYDFDYTIHSFDRYNIKI